LQRKEELKLNVLSAVHLLAAEWSSLKSDSEHTASAELGLVSPLLTGMWTMDRYIGNGFAQSISRQQLGKHVPTYNTGRCVSVDKCYSSLLGNSQHANELAG
jgi:hypothetical protein